MARGADFGGDGPSGGEMGCANAVRLFAERTAAMEPAFVLTDANAPRAAYDEKLIEATEVR